MSVTLLADQALTEKGWQRDLCVVIGDDGRIESVAAAAESASDCAESAVTQVGCLLPAPCNLHSHAFQRAMAGLTEARGPDPADSFWTWRRQMYRFLDQLDPDQVEAICAFVQMEMLESGYAAVGEFHYLHHQADGRPYSNLAEMAERVMAASRQTGIGLTLLPVLYHQGGCDGRPLGAGQTRFGNDPDRYERLYDAARVSLGELPTDAQMGVAPHSLRAVSPDALAQLLDAHPDGPVHIHAAEQTAEVDEVAAALGARPVQWLLDHADINARWCTIHATHLDDAEVVRLAQSGAVVGLCPITESNLGDGIFRAIDYCQAGGVLGVGSDSNVRISLSEELRTLEYSQRLQARGRALLANRDKSNGRYLYDSVLRGGAQACARDSGRIAVGAWADLVSLDVNAVDLTGRQGDFVLDSFIFARDDRLVQDVWSAGRHVVADGKHRGSDKIQARYKMVMRSLTATL